jgi:sulfite oxidase
MHRVSRVSLAAGGAAAAAVAVSGMLSSRQLMQKHEQRTARWASRPTFGVPNVQSTPLFDRVGALADFAVAPRLVATAQAQEVEKPGLLKPELPTFSLADIEAHSKPESGKMLVIFQRGVYDVTNFIPNHPGGARILLAGGKSVEPFWAIFQNHHEPHVYEILSELRVGNLKEEDYEEMQKSSAMDASDPYANDPHSERNLMLTVRSEKPFCAEPDPSVSLATFITNTPLHYIRNHMPVPDIKEEDYRLQVIGPDGKEFVFTLQELKEKFPKKEIVATLQCIGNRAQSLKKEKQVGTFYGTAISTSVWGGARMRDVLQYVGCKGDEDTFDADGARIAWINLDAADSDGIEPFAGCIPFEKGISTDGDTLLAYEMNGAAIPRDHGYPVRLLAPGYAGVRNLKWVTRVEVSAEESPRPNWDAEKNGMGQRIMEWPVNSYIIEPARGQKVSDEEGFFEAKGWAFSGGGRAISRVEVSWDHGRTWQLADLEQEDQPVYKSWAWTHWSLFVDTADIKQRGPDGTVELRVRAFDASYNSQPESPPNEKWVEFGCAANPIHRVNFQIDEGPDAGDAMKKRLRFIFNAYDADKNGVLTFDEVFTLLKATAAVRGDRMANDLHALNEAVAKTFEAVDTDGNGEIDFEEFCDAVKKNKLPVEGLFVK